MSTIQSMFFLIVFAISFYVLICFVIQKYLSRKIPGIKKNLEKFSQEHAEAQKKLELIKQNYHPLVYEACEDRLYSNEYIEHCTRALEKIEKNKNKIFYLAMYADLDSLDNDVKSIPRSIAYFEEGIKSVDEAQKKVPELKKEIQKHLSETEELLKPYTFLGEGKELFSNNQYLFEKLKTELDTAQKEKVFWPYFRKEFTSCSESFVSTKNRILFMIEQNKRFKHEVVCDVQEIDSLLKESNLPITKEALDEYIKLASEYHILKSSIDYDSTTFNFTDLHDNLSKIAFRLKKITGEEESRLRKYFK